VYLLDTNVTSELRKRHPHPGVVDWSTSAQGQSVFLSSLVVGEIRKGIENVRRRDQPRAQRLETWLDGLRHEYAERILPVTTEIAETWGRLNSPDPKPVIDGLLAATALVHDLTLVTRNLKDFQRTGTRCLNPFE
jgi:toxin FitB